MANNLFPKYDFKVPALDYLEVESTVKEMYSFLVSNEGCCKKCNDRDRSLCQVDSLLQAIKIDYDSGDLVRWENNVQAAYLLLNILV